MIRVVLTKLLMIRVVHLNSEFKSAKKGRTLTRVRPYEIKYLKIEVHNPNYEDLIELNPKTFNTDGLFRS